MARPRKQGTRTKSGRLSRAYRGPARDTGTPEVQVKRQVLVGANGDPMLSATAPGMLFANGYLSQDQYDAAMRYRSLHAALFGTPWPKPSWGTEIDDAALVEIRDEFDKKARRMTEDQRQIVTNVCVFDQRPNWFFVHRCSLHELPEDVWEREQLLAGLSALAGVAKARAA